MNTTIQRKRKKVWEDHGKKQDQAHAAMRLSVPIRASESSPNPRIPFSSDAEKTKDCRSDEEAKIGEQGEIGETRKLSRGDLRDADGGHEVVTAALHDKLSGGGRDGDD